MKKIVLLVLCCALVCGSFIACNKSDKISGFDIEETIKKDAQDQENSAKEVTYKYIPVLEDERSDDPGYDVFGTPLDREVEINGRKGIKFLLSVCKGRDNVLEYDDKGNIIFIPEHFAAIFSMKENFEKYIPQIEKKCLKDDGIEKSLFLFLELGADPYYAPRPYAIYYDDGKKPVYEFYIENPATLN